MHASESLRIFVVRDQIARSAQPLSKSYSIEERPVQRRSAPAFTTTRSVWATFPRPRARHSSTSCAEGICLRGEAVESCPEPRAQSRGPRT